MVAVENNVNFGVHSAMLLDISNGYKPYENSLMKILGNAVLNSSLENIQLNGGSNLDAWAVENGVRTNELTMTVRQLEPAMFQRFAGAIFSETAASTTGSIVDAIRNTNGTSVVDASTGIASVGITSGDEADLKSGNYLVVVTGSATVNLYIDTDIDFNEGTDVEFQDQAYKLLASDLTIAGTGGTTAVADYGITFTGGSGSVSMTTGDIAMFSVAGAHDGVYSYSIGENGEFPDYVGLALYGQKQADGTKWQIFFPKVKVNGLPVAFNEKAFGEAEITAIPVRATDPRDGVFRLYEVREIRGTNG